MEDGSGEFDMWRRDKERFGVKVGLVVETFFRARILEYVQLREVEILKWRGRTNFTCMSKAWKE